MVNLRSLNHVMRMNVYQIQPGQNGVNGPHVVKLVVGVPKANQEPVKCLNLLEELEILIWKKINHVLVHQLWFYFANWKIVHQKLNGDPGVHGANAQRIVVEVKEKGKDNAKKFKDMANHQHVQVIKENNIGQVHVKKTPNQFRKENNSVQWLKEINQ